MNLLTQLTHEGSLEAEEARKRLRALQKQLENDYSFCNSRPDLEGNRKRLKELLDYVGPSTAQVLEQSDIS